MSGLWRMEDGRVLEIKWMQSKHLAHCVNLLIRRNGLQTDPIEQIRRLICDVASVGRELDRRGYLRFMKSYGTNEVQVNTDLPRESIEDLCALHACLRYSVPIRAFKELEDLKNKKVLVEAVRLRMTR